MSKRLQDKEYQLWVWYGTESADAPQTGWTLAAQSDSPTEIFIARMKLSKEDESIVTEKIDLKVITTS